MASVFRVVSKVRGYHVYQSLWPNPFIGEEVSCERETGNGHDPQAVAMMKMIDDNEHVVGHVPRTISSVCSIFIRRGGNIVCRITGNREYSADLEQGGVQLPCTLTFSTPKSEESQKTRKSFKILSIDTCETEETMETDADTKPCLNTKVKDSEPALAEPLADKDLVQCSTTTLDEEKNFEFVDLTHFTDGDVLAPAMKKSKVFDSEGIIMGNELSDDEINLAQHLLKEQFSKLNGLRSTLFQSKQLGLTEKETRNKLQIIHCNSRHHWIVASTVGCTLNQVKVYDSLFTYCDKETESILFSLFQWNKSSKLVITVSRSQKQKGTVD